MSDTPQPVFALAPMAALQQAALAALRWELQGLRLMLPGHDDAPISALAKTAEEAAFDAHHDNLPV